MKISLYFLSKSLLIGFGFFLCSQTSLAQQKSFYDSLDLAKSELNQQRFAEAFIILDRLEERFPGEENLIRIKGLGLYWKKDFAGCKVYFEEKINTYSQLPWIKLDFGRILFELQEWKYSQSVLEDFLTFIPDDPEALQMLAAVNYWTGGNPSKSYGYLDEILNRFPDNPSAKQLKSEIWEQTAPLADLQMGYFSDSQPLSYLEVSHSMASYSSAIFQPGYRINFRAISSGERIIQGQVSNKTNILSTGTSFQVRLGFANSSAWDTPEILYGLSISQKIIGDWLLNLSADQEAYFYTKASIVQKVLPQTIKAEVGKDTGQKLTGKVSYQRSVFEDSNWVDTFSAWMLYPILKNSIFRLDLGYAFTLANSQSVRFLPDFPLSGPINSGEILPGIYSPYFTPINQQIHGGLAKLSLDLSQNIKFTFSGNGGFFAQLDNPNTVYYGNSINGNAPIPDGDIFLELYPTRYTPLDFSSTLAWKATRRTSLSFKHHYMKTIFFDSNLFQIGYNFRLGHD